MIIDDTTKNFIRVKNDDDELRGFINSSFDQDTFDPLIRCIFVPSKDSVLVESVEEGIALFEKKEKEGG